MSDALKATTIELEQDEGHWRAYQSGVDGIVGVGPNPGRAVANYGEAVAEIVYEGDEQFTDDELDAVNVHSAGGYYGRPRYVVSYVQDDSRGGRGRKTFETEERARLVASALVFHGRAVEGTVEVRYEDDECDDPEVRTDGGRDTCASGTDQIECTIMECSGEAEFAYWMPDLGHFSEARNPEHDLLEDGDFAPYVCESCRDRMADSPHWEGERFVRPQEKLIADGGHVMERGPAVRCCNGSCGLIKPRTTVHESGRKTLYRCPECRRVLHADWKDDGGEASD